MSVTLRTNLDYTEAVIADDGSLNLFYQIAGIISNDLRLRFLHKEDEFDSLNWGFKYKSQSLTLHYNIFNGISIFATPVKEGGKNTDKVITEMAALVGSRLKETGVLRKTA